CDLRRHHVESQRTAGMRPGRGPARDRDGFERARRRGRGVAFGWRRRPYRRPGSARAAATAAARPSSRSPQRRGRRLMATFAAIDLGAQSGRVAVGRFDGERLSVSEVPARDLYERTGIQLIPINTVFELGAMAAERDRALEAAETLLLIPDLMHYWLCGARTSELTNATTTQCFDPRAGTWAVDVLER